MDRYQEIIDRTRCVTRFLVPVMSDDPVPGREPRWGLTPEDFARVVHGYACPRCRACWDDGKRLKCPFCLHERTAADFLAGVKEWSEQDAYVEEQMANPERTEVQPMHRMVEELSRAHGVRPTYER